MTHNLSDKELYDRGYQILLDDGLTKEEIDSLEDDQVEEAAYMEEYFKGNVTMEIDAGLVNEHGEEFPGIPVQAYFNEPYEQAVKRHLNERGIKYDPDNILESAIDYEMMEEMREDVVDGKSTL